MFSTERTGWASQKNFVDEIGTFNSEVRRVNTLVTVAETFDNKVCGLGTILDARFLDFFH